MFLIRSTKKRGQAVPDIFDGDVFVVKEPSAFAAVEASAEDGTQGFRPRSAVGAYSVFHRHEARF